MAEEGEPPLQQLMIEEGEPPLQQLMLEDEAVETRTLGEIVNQREPDLRAIQLRLKQGADPNDPVEFMGGRSPLWWGAGHVQVVNALADAGADLGWKDPANGWTALHAAVMRAQNSQVGAVQSLAARGGQVEVDAQDNNGWTPLHKAAYNGTSAAAGAAGGGGGCLDQKRCWDAPDRAGSRSEQRQAQDCGVHLAGRRDAEKVMRCAAAASTCDGHAGHDRGGDGWTGRPAVRRTATYW
jgi:hypothetical protein